MKNFVLGYQIGSPAYLCTVAPFRPDIALGFYNELKYGNYKNAWQYVYKYEDQWLKDACETGWLQSIKSALKAHGLFPNNRLRSPRVTHTEEEYEKIKQSLTEIFG